jgi:putative two-component system response regulator
VASDDPVSVMVVDDSLTNLKSAKIALADVGDVFTAPSARKMFELLGVVRPSLILLDINMPEMTGLEALRILKNTPRDAGIPVIFLTSNQGSLSEIEGLSLGAVDYVTKPVEAVVLRNWVEVHLTLGKQRRDLEEKSLELKLFNDNLKLVVERETAKVTQLQGTIMEAVVDLVEGRDGITGGHVSRTAKRPELMPGGRETPGSAPGSRGTGTRVCFYSRRGRATRARPPSATPSRKSRARRPRPSSRP